MSKNDGGSAFPNCANGFSEPGLTLRDWFAGQALANPAICTGTAHEYQMKAWFGSKVGMTRAEIVSAQAYDHADAMLAEREK